MSDSQPTQAELEQYARAFHAVAGRLDEGRTPGEVTEELIASGVPDDAAVRLVEHVQEERHKHQQSGGNQSGERRLDLQERFPNLQPIKSSPPLFTLNGVGVSIYGSRDHDAETGTYVATHCLCFLFIPVLALGAYRVLPAGSQGWYFLGKEPLSRFAKGWNLLLLVCVMAAIGAGWWTSHVGSPEYQAQAKLTKAESAAEAGDFPQAARLLSEVARGGTSQAPKAAPQFRDLLTKVSPANVPLNVALQVFQNAAEIHAARGGLPEAVEPALKIASANKETSPFDAMRLVKIVSAINAELAGPVAAEIAAVDLSKLAAPDLIEFFGTAAKLVRLPADRDATFAAGAKQVDRLSSTDLKQAVTLLGTLSPLTDGAAVAERLKSLLSERATAMSAGELKEILGIAWGAFPSEAKDVLAQLGLDAVARHADWKARDALSFLDVFTNPDDRSRPKLDAEKRRLLEKVVADEPENVEAATQLAQVLEREGAFERIIETLTPHKERLSDGEGTRLLGQALARVGKFDESYALLNPYVEKRLGELHSAEKNFENQIQAVQNRVINQLKAGTASGFDFRRVQSLPKDQQDDAVREYLMGQMKHAPELNAARERIAKQSGIVPVALDLGIVTLRRGQEMADPDARKAELEKAEKTFLAIRGAAGEDDAFRLYLGQVYYWLGKHDEGKKLFDELLESQQRGWKILFQLGSILRDIGASREARALLEEAHGKAPTENDKHDVAHLRSMTSVELDDRIAWLRKSDPKASGVRADLASSLGRKAEEAGNDDEAARQYRESARIYDDQPESSATLNNAALAWIALYGVSGEKSALNEAARRMERGTTLEPSSAILLLNHANVQMRLAFAELAGAEISPHRLGLSANLAWLNALATDKVAYDALRRRVSESAALRRTLDIYEKGVVLAPKRIDAYGQLASIHFFIRDEAALRRLSERIDAAALDLTDVNERLEKSYREPTEDDRTRLQTSRERYRKLIAAFRDEKRPADFALAVSLFVSSQKHPIDDAPVDAEELVRLADEADALRTTSLTKETLCDALGFRACAALAEDDPSFASQWKTARRLLDPEYLVAAAIARPGPVGEAARKNADVLRLIELKAALTDEFLDTRSAVDWALVRKTRPEVAAKIAAHLKDSTTTAIAWRISRQLGPTYPTTILDEHFTHLAQGDSAAADTAIRRLAESKSPIPPELFDRDD